MNWSGPKSLVYFYSSFDVKDSMRRMEGGYRDGDLERDFFPSQQLSEKVVNSREGWEAPVEIAQVFLFTSATFLDFPFTPSHCSFRRASISIHFG